jgi:hypothetical protein
LIETSANQAYIFDTNRRRHVVGASYLIHQLGADWVPEAAAGSSGIEVVLAISGKALLLADDPSAARTAISAVSARALAEAPGLEVTGVVGPGFDPDLRWNSGHAGTGTGAGGTHPLNHVEALERTYELLEVAQEERPAPELRDPMLPWFEVCRDSGLPAAGIEHAAEGGYAAAGVLAKSQVRGRAGRRMRALLSGLPDVVPNDPDDLGNDGWVAVIHADGNRVGSLFTGFPQRALQAAQKAGDEAAGLSLRRHTQLLKDFTGELERATVDALWIAVQDVTQGRKAKGTILPVVVAGDDITVVCHARIALDLVRRFALAFEEQTAVQPTVKAIAGSGLTAAAGVAYVKRHHPFSAAYTLAEELTASAKRVRRAVGQELSSVDLHVAFESTLADLASLRRQMAAGGLSRHGGPYVIAAGDGATASPRDIAKLDKTIETVSKLSSSLAHDLREGLAIGEAEYRRRVRLAALSPDLPEDVRSADIEDLAPAMIREDGDAEDVKIVRLLDALLLHAITKEPPADLPGPPVEAASGAAQ